MKRKIETVRTFKMMLTAAMKLSKEDYSKHDKKGIDKNIALVIGFFQEANKHRFRGFKKTQKWLIEDLRANTSARDTDRVFKINNDCIALLAHLYNDCLPKKYFRTKTRNKSLRAA